MSGEYIGKICLSCNQRIADGETIVLCDTCQLPQHLPCWQKNRGCTTPGCKGKIKAFIQVKAMIPVAPAPVAPAYSASHTHGASTPTPAPVTARPSELSPAPAYVPTPAKVSEPRIISSMRVSKPSFFTSPEEEILPPAGKASVTPVDPVSATPAEEAPTEFIPVAPVEQVPAQYTPIPSFDDTIEPTIMVSGKPNCVFDVDSTVAVSRAPSSAHAMAPVVPDYEYRSVETAPHPVYDFNSQEITPEPAQDPKAGKKAPKEKKPKKEKKAKKKKTGLIIVIWLLVLALLGAATVFVGIPYYKYYTATKALENGEYDTAYEAFTNLEDFMDSAEQAKISRYEKAKVLFVEGQFDSAREIFLELKKFKDSDELANKCLYRKAELALDAKEFDTAKDIFTQLGDYENSGEMAQKSIYMKAENALENKQFDSAHDIFTELGTYSNSAEMADRALYLKGQDALEQKKFDEAYAIFSAMPSVEDSAEMAKEAQYQKALALIEADDIDAALAILDTLEGYKDSADQSNVVQYHKAEQLLQNKEYEEAYEIFISLGNYSDSQAKADALVLTWLQEALAANTTDLATSLRNTVTLSSRQNASYYTAIVDFINAREDPSFWFNNLKGTVASKNVFTVLKLVPTGYENTQRMQELFGILASATSYADIFVYNDLTLDACWEFAFLQKMAKLDDAFSYFLVGYWYSDYNMFDMAYDDSTGGLTLDSDVPCVDQPTDGHHFEIMDTSIYWAKADGTLITKIYDITVDDFHNMTLYSYKDSQTYIMVRY